MDMNQYYYCGKIINFRTRTTTPTDFLDVYFAFCAERASVSIVWVDMYALMCMWVFQLFEKILGKQITDSGSRFASFPYVAFCSVDGLRWCWFSTWWYLKSKNSMLYITLLVWVINEIAIELIWALNDLGIRSSNLIMWMNLLQIKKKKA